MYGANGPNFVQTMARLPGDRDTVSVVDDQGGQSTWTVDLAHAIVRLVEAEAPCGTYHGTSSGETTWFGFAQEIFRLSDRDPARVLPTTSDAFVRPAPWPTCAVRDMMRGTMRAWHPSRHALTPWPRRSQPWWGAEVSGNTQNDRAGAPGLLSFDIIEDMREVTGAILGRLTRLVSFV